MWEILVQILPFESIPLEFDVILSPLLLSGYHHFSSLPLKIAVWSLKIKHHQLWRTAVAKKGGEKIVIE